MTRESIPVERARAATDLVLVGGGHAHVQVLRALARRPLPGVRVRVVLDRAEAVYSGMVPGFVAGDYRACELTIDVAALARRARADVILAAATRVDPVGRRIELAGAEPVAYGVASLDVGASLRGLELPGVRAHALATRPISDLVDALDARIARAAAPARATPLRVALVGGGAAGLELAFCVEARLRRAGHAVAVTLYESERELSLPRGLARRALSEAQERGVRIRTGAAVTRVDPDALWLGAERVAAELVVWSTGAAPWPWLAASPLPRDPQGFVRARPTLQVVGHDDLFAAGDCVALEGSPWVPKAGVHAVREGPVLDANLRARLAGGGLRTHRPQRDFLTLLNLGDRRALGARTGLSARGRWVWWLKDRIDRRFVRRFQVDAANAVASSA
jgi:selenide,water dikinase